MRVRDAYSIADATVNTRTLASISPMTRVAFSSRTTLAHARERADAAILNARALNLPTRVEKLLRPRARRARSPDREAVSVRGEK